MTREQKPRQRRSDDPREEILERLATAYKAADEATVGRTRIAYATEPGSDPEALLALARERFENQEVGYHILPGWDSLLDTLANHLYSRQARRVAVQSCELFDRLGLVQALAGRVPDLCVLGPGAGLDEIAAADVGITTCEAVIAQTGTLVLNGIERSTLGLSLLGGVHFCVAAVRQLVPDLEGWLSGRPAWFPDEACILVSGPSRTADIEKTVVIGVHGPWKVSLFLVKE